MRVIECDQNSHEWLAERRGRITASRIANVMSTLKRGGEGADRKNYRTELIAERLSGRAEDHYTSPEMMWGTENEPYARAAYEIGCGVMVDQVGFVLHPTMDFSGGSPDGLVGEDGMIEIKCGKTTTHLKWLMAGEVPEEHQDQILWNLCCTERKWCDFISFDPRLPDGLNIFIVRMQRDEKRIANIEAEVKLFNDQVDAVAADLRKRQIVRPAAPIDTRTPLEQLEALMDQQELVP